MSDKSRLPQAIQLDCDSKVWWSDGWASGDSPQDADEAQQLGIASRIDGQLRQIKYTKSR
jgi:hypothetical protein